MKLGPAHNGNLFVIGNVFDRFPLPLLIVNGRMTVSVGATSYRKGDDTDTMFIRADEALYRAKRSGKNRTVVL